MERLFIDKVLINIKEYKRRVWGENGTPPTDHAIRYQCKQGNLPALKIGRDWYIDWNLINQKDDTLSLVRGVLENGSETKKTKQTRLTA